MSRADPHRLARFLLDRDFDQLDPDEQKLRLGAAPSLPDFFRTAVDGISVSRCKMPRRWLRCLLKRDDLQP